MKFYKCNHCGNVITKVVDKNVPIICCGEQMKELVPNTVEAAVEKHKPVVNVNGEQVTIQVGSVEHPMTDEHYIQFVVVEFNDRHGIIHLKPGQKPIVQLQLKHGQKINKVYAYCNLHGLWSE